MLNDHLTVLPILIPLTGAMITLMLRQTRRLQAAFALGSMLMSLAVSTWLTAEVWQGGQPIVFHSGSWSAPFGITLVGDLLSSVFVLMSQLVLTTGIIYAIGSKDAVVKYPTFYPLFLMLATSLTTTEESMALTAVGEAVWKSGCQKWKGKTALLTIKVAIKNPIPGKSKG